MRRAGRIASTVALVAALALAALIVVPGLLGFERYVVVSGSMTGTYDQGSLIFGQPTPIADLRKGDVITFRPPRGSQPLTHRIVWVGQARGGQTAFRTKGDANQSADHFTFVPRTPELPRAEYGIPMLGYVYGALSWPIVKLLGVVIPAFLLAGLVLVQFWRDAGEETRAASDGPATAEPA